MTLFEAEKDLPRPRRSGAPVEVVVRTPAPSGPEGTFVSVVVVAQRGDQRVEGDLAELEAALSAAYPVHEIVLTAGVAGTDPLGPWPRRAPGQPAGAGPPARRQRRGRLHGRARRCPRRCGRHRPARLGVNAPADVVRCAALVTEDSAVVIGADAAGRAGRRVAVRLGRALVRRTLGEGVSSVSLGLRGYSRAALEAWLLRRDRDRVLRVLPTISGYPSTLMQYTSGARTRSATATGVRQVLRSVFYASSRPLRFAVGIAVVASLLNLLYALYVVGVGIFSGAVAGWTSTSLQMSLMFFLLSVVIEIMAEFMFQSKDTAKERPIYRVAFEATSSVLEARQMPNVEAEASAVQTPDDARQLASWAARPDGR